MRTTPTPVASGPALMFGWLPAVLTFLAPLTQASDCVFSLETDCSSQLAECQALCDLFQASNGTLSDWGTALVPNPCGGDWGQPPPPWKGLQCEPGADFAQKIVGLYV